MNIIKKIQCYFMKDQPHRLKEFEDYFWGIYCTHTQSHYSFEFEGNTLTKKELECITEQICMEIIKEPWNVKKMSFFQPTEENEFWFFFE